MSKARGFSRTRMPARSGSVEVYVRPERMLFVRVLVLLWRLRTELTVLMVAVWAWRRLRQEVPHRTAVVLVVVAVVAALAVGPSRRWLVAHVWCTATRHRLRSCLVQVRAVNHDGYVPWFLWVRPTNVGERVTLLLRPGLSVGFIEERAEHIAAACWAREARVRRARRLAALVTVDTVRRDVLAPSKTVGSPLTGLAGTAPRSGSDLAPVLPIPAAAAPVAASVGTAAVASLASRRPDVPVLVGGEDVSDYV